MLLLSFTTALIPVLVGASILPDHGQPQFPFTERIGSRGECSRYTSYTAIGDSYSCGYGAGTELEPCKEGEDSSNHTCATVSGCHQYNGAFSYLLYESLGISKFQYLACNGDYANNIIKQVESDGYGTPDLVTLTSGGGDIGFANIGAACVYLQDPAGCDEALDEGFKRIEKLPEKYDRLINTIRKKSPHATIVALSYVSFWDASYIADSCPLAEVSTKSQRKRMNKLADQVRDYLEAAVDRQSRHDDNIHFVDMNDAWEGRRLCDREDTWFITEFKSFNEITVLHPNEDGQRSYLKMLKNVLNCS